MVRFFAFVSNKHRLIYNVSVFIFLSSFFIMSFCLLEEENIILFFLLLSYIPITIFLWICSDYKRKYIN